MTEPATNTLDLLMALDPLELTKQDLKDIVAYHRNLRAEREAGRGRAARAATKPAQKLDIHKLMGMTAVSTPTGGTTIKRRQV